MKKKTTAKPTNLDKKLAEAEAAKLRLAAELANQHRRFEQEKTLLKTWASAELLEKIFPVFDNFYRAAAHAPEVNSEDVPSLTAEDAKKISTYLAGLKMIEHQMEQVLGEAGLKKVPTIGHEFDPNLHEALSHEPSDLPADQIIGEIESGWLLGDKVLKPAKVRVSKG